MIENEPPAVRMNDMLGGLLTHKLAGEDAVSGQGTRPIDRKQGR